MDEFISETQKQIFNAADIHLMPIERIWDEIGIEFSEIKTISEEPI